MSNGDYRPEYGNSGGSFVIGLLTGAVLGAGLGMLFAPKSGAHLRSQISERAESLATTATEGYKRAAGVAGGWVDKVDKTVHQLARS
jgi:gas vesicle protein